MAGGGIERGVPGDPKRENVKSQPRPFITGEDEFDVVNFGQRVKARFRLTRNGPEIIGFEELVTDAERRAQAESLFTETIVPLIDVRLELRAAKRSPGAETVNLEMSEMELLTAFNTGTTTLYGLGANQRELEEIIIEQSRQITRGETVMGRQPGLVKSQAQRLAERVKRLNPRPEHPN